MQKVKDKVEQRADEKTDEAIDKSLDEVEEGAEESVSSDDEENAEEAESEESAKPAKKAKKAESENAEETAEAPAKSKFKSYSKYDFIPGDQTLLYEDFSQDAIGDFPAKWNTNGSGEVVTIDGHNGQWFKFTPGSIYSIDFNQLPENFTIEFDFIQRKNEFNPGDFALKLNSCEADESIDAYVPGYGGAAFRFSLYDISAWNWKDQEYKNVDSHLERDVLDRNDGKVIRASIWGQKERIRLYLNQEKIYDLPRCLFKDLKYNRLIFESHLAEDGQQELYVSNLRIAAGAPDMRSKLLTEGKLVTRGILFDSGSDKIKPESYPTLKSIADVLKQNGDVKVKIVGHTDSDGQDAANLELSKKRSASVKNALTGEFGIDASRMETDGKGETEPASNNNTPEGKADNRRVEFIKL
jgi:outer membrane protein OmpA-like peptidoglycan-associated protein